MKKLNAIVCALLAAGLLVSCDSGETPAEESTETTAAPAVMKTLMSASVGSDYSIVRSDVDHYGELDCSKTLQAAIQESIGIKLALKTDWYKENMGTPPQPHEILMGTTNREETAALEESWRPNGALDWTVRLSGEKILIYGGSESALEQAVAYFIENCIVEGTVVMEENFSYTYVYAWPLDAIMVGEKNLAEYQIVVSANADSLTNAAATLIQNNIKALIGAELPIVIDSHTTQKTDYEILVGKTNRTEKVPSDPLYVTTEGSRVLIGGENSFALYAAVEAFRDGSAGSTVNGVYTLSSYTGTEYSLLNEGAVTTMMSYVDQRAALGRERHLTELMKNELATGDAFLETDFYANLSSMVLCMPEDEVNDKQLAFANKVVRKVTGYMNTDTPPSKKSRITGEVDFAAARLARCLYAPEGRLEEETAAALKRFFLNDDFQSVYYSENHMFMFRVARYLAACYYEGETFNQYKMSAEQMRQQEHDYLVEFLKLRAQYGWGEFDSMGYTIENFLNLLNLYDCAPDDDLVQLAKMTMDSLLLNMIVDTTENGMYGGAHGRSYDSVVTDMRCRFFWVYQFFFGEHGFDDIPAAAKDIGISNTPCIFVSDYRPDGILYAIVADKQYPFENREAAHNPAMKFEFEDLGVLSKYTYNTELYSIGCVNNQEPYPAGHADARHEDTQQTNFSLIFAENSKVGITVHHPGEASGHDYWYGDAQCNCNHFFGNKNTVMGIFYIPGSAGSYKFIHAHVEKSQFDEVIEQPEQNRIFVREGDAYAMLQFSQSYSWSPKDASEVMIYDGTLRTNIRLAFVCEAGMKSEYGDFAGFVSAMEKKEMNFDRDTLTLEYGNMKLHLEYNKRDGVTEYQYLDGVLQEYPYAYTYDSPFMRSKWGSGVIEVTYGDTVRVMDFMNITDTTKKK